jgi:mono/diheme cytochrome c family protein
MHRIHINRPILSHMRLMLGALFALNAPTLLATPDETSAARAESRGEMLYSLHCGNCHAQQVHWRQNKLATNPLRLRQEVIRWKNNAAPEWNNDDLDEVTRYLDAAFYRFDTSNTAPKP